MNIHSTAFNRNFYFRSRFLIMEELNYNEFERHTADDWQKLVLKELKGKKIEDIVWHVEDGVSCLPYQTVNSALNKGLFRAKVEGSYQWRLAQSFDAQSLKTNGSSLEEALSLGCNSVTFNNLSDWNDLKLLTKDVDLDAVHLQLSFHKQADSRQIITDLCLDEDRPKYLALNMDFFSETDGLDILREYTEHGLKHNIPLALVDSGLSDKGADAGLELGVTLAMAHEILLTLMESRGPDDVAPLLRFQFGVGSNYFAEIAKFRAFRMLWQSVVEEYNPSHACSGYAYLNATSSLWGLSSADTHSNLLRLTTQCAAAAIGGADAICLLPFNVHSYEKGPKAERFSLNIQNILLWEGRLGVTSDPAAGSYFLEDLTHKIGGKSWRIFQEIEALGGYSRAVKSGWLSQMVSDSLLQSHQVDKSTGTMIGVNKYVSPFEKETPKPAGHRLENLLIS